MDDLAFGKHQGISKEEIQEIISNGKIILIEDDEGELIGETQLLLEQTPP